MKNDSAKEINILTRENWSSFFKCLATLNETQVMELYWATALDHIKLSRDGTKVIKAKKKED